MISQLLDPQFLLALAKVTAILVVALVLAPLIKRPDLRASFWTVSILSLPLVFVCSYSFSVLELIPHESEAAVSDAPIVESKLMADSEPYLAPEPTLVASPVEALSVVREVVVEPAVVEQPQQATVHSETPWLAIAYLSGALIVLAPWLISFLQLSLLKKTRVSGKPREIWHSLFSRLSLKAELKFTPSPSAPFASGLIKPSILIPNDSVDWNPRRLQSVLLHEAAHLKRRDPLTRFLSSVVKALFWFHPLAWLAHRQLISSQEQACDQFALTHGIAPTDYAEDLLHSATHSQTTPSEALAMARWSQLGNRIRHILNTKNHRPCTMKQIITLCGIFAIAAVTLSTVGFATEKTEVAQADSFLSREEASALDSIEKLQTSFGPKHPKLLEQRNKIPELKIFLAENGKRSWQLTTGPHFHNKGETPGELTRLLKIVPDLVLKIHAREQDKLEDVTSLMKVLRKTGATNLSVVMAKEKKKETSRFGVKRATAVIQIHPSVIALGRPLGAAMTNRYMENEMESISAPETLRLANQTLRLGFGSEEEAIKYLENHHFVKPVRGTDLLQIHADHKERAVAAQIANALAKAYEKRRNEIAKKYAQKALNELNEELEAQNQLVLKNRKHLTGLIAEIGHNPDMTLLSLKQLQTSLEKLESAKGAEKFSVAASIQKEGNQVPTSYQEYRAALEGADFLVQNGIGSKHPEVIAIRGRVDRAYKKLEAEVGALENLLKQDLKKSKLLKEKLITPENAQRQYRSAKEEYEQSRLMYREMSVKQQEQRVLLKMPRTPITIHELAK